MTITEEGVQTPRMIKLTDQEIRNLMVEAVNRHATAVSNNSHMTVEDEIALIWFLASETLQQTDPDRFIDNNPQHGNN
jgi:hypothetical protein